MRHLLPVLPMLYLPVAMGVARSRAASMALVTVLAVESLLLAPLWMSATNTWWLADRNPTRFSLGGGDLEYGQNFIQLARETRRRNIDSLRVLYPVLEQAVLAAYLPDARLVGPGDEIEPGWYAVNVSVEQLVPAVLAARPESLYNYDGLTDLAARWRPFWHRVAAGEDHGYVAATFHLYHHAEPHTPFGHAAPKNEKGGGPRPTAGLVMEPGPRYGRKSSMIPVVSFGFPALNSS